MAQACRPMIASVVALICAAGCTSGSTQVASELAAAGSAVASASLALDQFGSGHLSQAATRTALGDARTEVGSALDALAATAAADAGATQALELVGRAGQRLAVADADLARDTGQEAAAAADLHRLAGELATLQQQLGSPR